MVMSLEMFKNISCNKRRTKQDKVESDMVGAEAAFVDKELKGSLIDVQEFNKDWVALGSPRCHISDDGLAYSISALISAFDPYNEGKISQTKFYKLLYILSANLKNKGIDIKLPYFWYRHGPVVPYSFLPEDIIELHSMNWSKHQGKLVVLRKREFPAVAANKKETIDDAVAALLEQYNETKTPKIVSDVYATAPYNFQRDYKEFIKHIDNKIKYRDIICSVQDLKIKEDIARLEKAVNFFDETQFPQIYDNLLQWKLIMKYSINQLAAIDLAFASRLSNIYWDELFCMFLKVKEYQYLPERLIAKWQRDLQIAQDEYESHFKKIEEQFYSSIYHPTTSLDNGMRNAYCECLGSLFK
jgi:hypothetical protein